MLNLYKPLPCFPLWRRIFAPFYYFDQIKIILPPIVLIFIIAFSIRDMFVLIPALSVVYFGFILTMQKFNPFRILVETSRVDEIVSILDKTQFLTRCGKSLRWERVQPFSWASSKLDAIEIENLGEHMVVRGRKQDIIALSRALNR